MDNIIKPKIIVSRCLLGIPCRYDNTDKFSHVCDSLKNYVDFVDICPEMDIGLGSPRETLRLAYDSESNIKMISNESDIDITMRMNAYLDEFFDTNRKIDGAILKSKSPSCGHLDVEVFVENLPQDVIISGIFTDRLIKEFPNIIIENEERLNDKCIMDKFIKNISKKL